MSGSFRGIFSIPQTPFNEQGDLLWDDFERECDWIVRAGAHGLVWPVMASEYTVISYLERVQGMKQAVQAVGGRVPVVIGVADTSTAGAVALAREAARAGADAVIAMPPWATKMTAHDLIADYYRAIATAAGLPVVIQNVGPPLGSNLPGAFVVELCDQIPLVQYLKEEKDPKGQALSDVLALGSAEVKGVFSGSQCYWLISDYQRGACGCMPASRVVDVDVHIWELLEAGHLDEARRVHRDKMVFENILLGMPARIAGKEVLRRRGVLSCNAARNEGSARLDVVDLSELEYGMGVVAPYFRV
jgi:dihydrodipicolinate synthase/N-acetylneuraminate lyase